jgi:hypothetical protein
MELIILFWNIIYYIEFSQIIFNYFFFYFFNKKEK